MQGSLRNSETPSLPSISRVLVFELLREEQRIQIAKSDVSYETISSASSDSSAGGGVWLPFDPWYENEHVEQWIQEQADRVFGFYDGGVINHDVAAVQKARYVTLSEVMRHEDRSGDRKQFVNSQSFIKFRNFSHSGATIIGNIIDICRDFVHRRVLQLYRMNEDRNANSYQANR
ncbi:unnamed protein product [Periconia digitata]|uniref:Uncharacterized protein n=1 Tax=Periconia digitata TaxID=1303443 RepID=A0A9W4XJL1_9PLEO|nr:unnamed protein product [Periconia digitata]